MRLGVTFLLIIVLISCQDSRPADNLTGVWCDENNHCIFFDEKECIIDKAVVHDYKVLSDHEIELDEDFSKKYRVEINFVNLSIKENKRESFRVFKKCIPKNKIIAKKLSFSILSEFSDFDFCINSSREVFLRIHHHHKFESGDYVSNVPVVLFSFMNKLANGMSLELQPRLKKGIVSDIDEWAIKLVSEEDYLFYYNYEQTNKDHQNLALLLKRMPYFLRLEKGEVGDELVEIKGFREKEFKRNLREKDL